MAKHSVVTMPGDGIGNQVLPEALRVLNAVGFDAEYIHADIGWDSWRNQGNALPNTNSACSEPSRLNQIKKRKLN
jgi:3-isopropylmalate dehydrogenase